MRARTYTHTHTHTPHTLTHTQACTNSVSFFARQKELGRSQWMFIPTEERLLFTVYYYQCNSWQITIVVSENLMTHFSLFALMICAMILKWGYEKVATRESLRCDNTRSDRHSLTHWHVCTYEHVCRCVRTFIRYMNTSVSGVQSTLYAMNLDGRSCCLLCTWLHSIFSLHEGGLWLLVDKSALAAEG
jgi:hypothetical protein